MTEEFLIDSGASVNIIPKDVWDKCWDDEDMFIYDLDIKGKRTITAYGSKPLKVYGTFRAYIEVPGTCKPKSFETFIIVDEPGIPLLGFHTARRLKILQVGTDVNFVSKTSTRNEFQKIPGLRVKFLVDGTVQPTRNNTFRIPASLE